MKEKYAIMKREKEMATAIDNFVGKPLPLALYENHMKGWDRLYVINIKTNMNGTVKLSHNNQYQNKGILIVRYNVPSWCVVNIKPMFYIASWLALLVCSCIMLQGTACRQHIWSAMSHCIRQCIAKRLNHIMSGSVELIKHVHYILYKFTNGRFHIL